MSEITDLIDNKVLKVDIKKSNKNNIDSTFKVMYNNTKNALCNKFNKIKAPLRKIQHLNVNLDNK